MTGYLIKATNTKDGSILYLNSWASEGDNKFVDFTYNVNEAMFLSNNDNKVIDFFKNLIKSLKGDKYKCEVVRVQRITVIVEPNMNLA